MTTFTIHTDETLADAIRRGAADAGVSINKFIRDAVGAAVGLFGKDRRPLPDFFDVGERLTREEAAELRAVQNEFDVIDPEIWK